MVENLPKIMYWGLHFSRHAPGLLHLTSASALDAVARRRLHHQILIGAHHKILTVFFGRVFRIFSTGSFRSISRGRGASVNYTADIIIDHHSDFAMERIRGGVRGIHVRRDPRDLIVSSAFYHQKSNESWLHIPVAAFGGQTYQERIKSLSSFEDTLLFEIDYSAGEDVQSLLKWNYNNNNSIFSELKYEDLVSENGDEVFSSTISTWDISNRDKKLLVGLFRYFSVGNPGFKGVRHARNPEAGQWRRHFTPAVERRFAEVFPDAVARLGYAD